MANRFDDLIKRYDALKRKVVAREKEFKELMEFVENETSYMTCPASTHYHLCRECGLLEHSINVAENLLKIKRILAPDITDESCVVVALMHDLGKAGVPGKPQYFKNMDMERPWPPYKFNTDLVYMSVPVRSLYLVSRHFPLSEDEAQAIVYHDGQYVDDNRSVAGKEEPLTLLLQYSDNWSGFVQEEA
jgi:hypothetical protein